MGLLLQLKMMKMFIFQVSAWCYQHFFVRICTPQLRPSLLPSIHTSLTLSTLPSLTSYFHSDHWPHWQAKFWFCVPTISHAFICVINYICLFVPPFSPSLLLRLSFSSSFIQYDYIGTVLLSLFLLNGVFPSSVTNFLSLEPSQQQGATLIT